MSVSPYGPNGTHWPGSYDFIWPNDPTRLKLETPFPGDRNDPEKIPYVYEVNCSYAAIQSRLEQITTAQANAGVLILVRPGTLQGAGTDTSGGNKVLNEVGDPTWTKRVTIAPRDGFGSVQVTNSRYFRTHNICIAGFEFTDSLRVEACRNFGMAWCTWRIRITFVHFFQDTLLEGAEFCEVVNYNDVYDAQESTEDNIEIYGTNSGQVMEYYRFAGCYISSRWLDKSKSRDFHIDAIQWGPVGSLQQEMLLEDNVLFASTNAAIQTGGVLGMYLYDNLLIGGTLAREYWPRPSTAHTGTAIAWINGNSTNMYSYRNYGSGGGSLSGGPPSYFHWEHTEDSYTTSPNYNGWTPDEAEPATEAERLSGNTDEPARTGYWNTDTDESVFRELIPQIPNFYTLYEAWKSLAPTGTRWTPNNTKRPSSPKRVGLRI